MPAALLSFPRIVNTNGNGNGNSVATAEPSLMNASRERTLITRFQKVVRDQSALDFDRALLAKEIRDEFLPGEDGDFQFRLWLRTKVGVRSNGAERLNTLARAVTLYPARAYWDMVGGSATMIFLLGLSNQQRNRVFNSLRRKANTDGHNLSRAVACKVARSLGIVSPSKRGPGRLRLRFDTLAVFVRSLPPKLLTPEIEALLK